MAGGKRRLNSRRNGGGGSGTDGSGSFNQSSSESGGDGCGGRRWRGGGFDASTSIRAGLSVEGGVLSNWHYSTSCQDLVFGPSTSYHCFGSKTWYLNASLLLPFEELKSLDLSFNYLGGWIAPEEPHLLSSRRSKLEVLDLRGNFMDHYILSILDTIPSLQHLILRKSNLSGTLHVDGAFSNLMELDMSYNAIDAVAIAEGGFNNLKELGRSGNPVNVAAIAEGIKNLSHLENLYLDDVHLKDVGTIVRALGALSSLKILSLQDNTLEGTITTQDFHNFSKLEQLILDHSSLNTTMGILYSLGPLTSLRLLSSYNTGLNDKLSDQSLCNLVKLKELDLSSNRITGFKVTSLGFLNHQYDLRTIDLSSNDILGPFLAWLLENNTKLENLFMANNLFAIVEVPLMTLRNLSMMDMSNNDMRGELTTEFCLNFPNLSNLNLSANKLEGNIPYELLPRVIANMSRLALLDLSKNKLNGLIPQGLFNHPRLEYLALSDNNLSGSLPSSFIGPELTHIHLNGNKLNGSIVHLLPNSSNLVTLDLSENEFFGSIPYWLGNLSQLSILLLRGYADKVASTWLSYIESPSIPYVSTIRSHTRYDHDRFLVKEAWQIPHIVGFTAKRRFYAYKGYALLNMVGLDFSCNQFSGEIPPEIAISQDMIVLNLSHNKLTGHIPMSLSNLTQIESIDLSYNNLTSSIPEELTRLNFMGVFNVSYNNLSGAIPNKNQFGSFDESSYYGNHLLCGLLLSNDCSTTINVNCSATKSHGKAKEDGFIDGETFYISFGMSYMTVLLDGLHPVSTFGDTNGENKMEFSQPFILCGSKDSQIVAYVDEGPSSVDQANISYEYHSDFVLGDSSHRGLGYCNEYDAAPTGIEASSGKMENQEESQSGMSSPEQEVDYRESFDSGAAEKGAQLLS
ncbi:receptor-like protein 9b [Eucalyptus grandis]|uniref:receptor-like protein 9b n=1 Tax=Eucalyptus grandis TaxID=71139 RepID=UPI00192F08DF|nr:receptor-like protein 9b [Eucalyptus grandis]